VKIVFLVTDDWFFWSHRAGLARAVRDAGAEVVVATSGEPGRFREEGFTFEPVSFGRKVAGQLKNLGLRGRLKRLYRRHRPDLVHHVSFLPIVYGSAAARSVGVPCVVNAVTGLGHAFISERSSVLRRLIELAYRRSLADERVHTILQNPDDLGLLVERGLVDPARAHVVAGSGVDMEVFHSAPEPPVDPGNGERPTVLFCARMLWSKGVEVLVEAGRILRERGVAHELHLVGEPHPSNPDSVPEAVLSAWHAAGEVRWSGFRDDVADLVRSSHVVCLPSFYREGVPKALIEGAACARPLVSTDAPGCREIVQDGENGLLVPPRDPRALADALEGLLLDPAERRAMGERGERLVRERFSMEVVNGAVLGIYRELLGGTWAGGEAKPVAARRPLVEPASAVPLREAPVGGDGARGNGAPEAPENGPLGREAALAVHPEWLEGGGTKG